MTTSPAQLTQVMNGFVSELESSPEEGPAQTNL
jgi:hypothetical protein